MAITIKLAEKEEILLSNIRQLCKERGIKNKDLAAYLGLTGNVITEWYGHRSRSFAKYVHAIAAFFSLPVEALTGDAPLIDEASLDSEHDLKVALFGGDSEVTDEMWDEVKKFAAYVKEKHRKA